MNFELTQNADKSGPLADDRLIDWGLRNISASCRETAPDLTRKVLARLNRPAVVRSTPTVRLHKISAIGETRTARRSWAAVVVGSIALTAIGILLIANETSRRSDSPMAAAPDLPKEFNPATVNKVASNNGSVVLTPGPASKDDASISAAEKVATTTAKNNSAGTHRNASTQVKRFSEQPPRKPVYTDVKVVNVPPSPLTWNGKEIQLKREYTTVFDTREVGYTVHNYETRLGIETYTARTNPGTSAESTEFRGRLSYKTVSVPGPRPRREIKIARSVEKSAILLNEDDLEIDINSKVGQRLAWEIRQHEAKQAKANDETRRLEFVRLTRDFDKQKLDYDNRLLEFERRNVFTIPTDADARSSFSLSVGKYSLTNLRRYLSAPYMLKWWQGSAVVENLINTFEYNYANKPSHSDFDPPLAIHPEVADCPWNVDHKLIRIGIQAQAIPAMEHKPINAVIVVDLQKFNRMNVFAPGLLYLINRLDENDRIAIVDNSKPIGRIVLPATAGNRRKEILGVLHRMVAFRTVIDEVPNESENPGLELAYEIAGKNLTTDGQNWVMYCHSGDATTALSNRQEEVEELVKTNNERNSIQFTALDFAHKKTGPDSSVTPSPDPFNELLRRMAEVGQGGFHAVGDSNAATQIIGHRLVGATPIAAEDAKIQVEFNSSLVHKYRLLGFQSVKLGYANYADESSPGAKFVSNGQMTAIYEVIPTDAAASESNQSNQNLCTIRMKYRRSEDSPIETFEVPVPGNSTPFEKASSDFRFASAVAGFGMLVRKSHQMGTASFETMHQLAESAIGEDPTGDRSEFVELMKAASNFPVSTAP